MRSPVHSVRYVRHGVRHSVRHQTRAVSGLCGMCGIKPHAPTRTKTHHHRAHVSSRARKTYRTSRTCRTPLYLRGFRVISYRTPYRTHTAHPLIPLFLLKRKEVEEQNNAQSAKEGKPTARLFLRCNEDNVAEFNARLRAEAPEAFALAKALHKAGMLDGLNGACIGPVGSLPGGGVVPFTSVEAEVRIADIHWQRRGGRK